MRLDPALPPDCTRIITTFLVGHKSLRLWNDALEEGIIKSTYERERRLNMMEDVMAAPLAAWVARRRLQQGGGGVMPREAAAAASPPPAARTVSGSL